MNYYAGLDVSLKEISICVIDGTGTTVARGVAPTDPEGVAGWFRTRSLSPELIVHESGQLSIWLQRGLERLGLPVFCIDARRAHKSLSARPNKSDAADAEGLAQLARTGWFTSVHVRTEEADRLRALVSARAQLIALRKDLEGHMRGILKTFGIHLTGIVGYARRNFMVPIPRSPSWDAVNADLEAQCRKRQNDVLRGHKETIGERLKRDLAAMKPLPGGPFEACAQASGRVSSQCLVRYETNDYSVPVAYGHQDVWVRGYVDQVVIGCRGDVIARHPRCYAREDVVFDPVHYLPLIERKLNALDQAAPLAEWDLPEEFQTLRRLMEAHMLKMGRREYVQVLRLLETFGIDDLHAAVKDALRLRATGFDAVKHLLLCRIEKRPPKLDLASYPYLPHADVETTSAASYMTLMAEATE